MKSKKLKQTQVAASRQFVADWLKLDLTSFGLTGDRAWPHLAARLLTSAVGVGKRSLPSRPARTESARVWPGSTRSRGAQRALPNGRRAALVAHQVRLEDRKSTV